jgi:hypothetical protein
VSFAHSSRTKSPSRRSNRDLRVARAARHLPELKPLKAVERGRMRTTMTMKKMTWMILKMTAIDLPVAL